MVSDAAALLELLRELKSRRYEFVTTTPASHERVLARPSSGKVTLRDVFGWNRPFSEPELDPTLVGFLRGAGCLEDSGGKLRSRVRVASVGGELFLHSAFPTNANDAVFLGPDTYRFVRFVRSSLPQMDKPAWVVDMGAGSGAGGTLVGILDPTARITLVDVNAKALGLAKVNARAALVPVELSRSDRIPSGCDVVIANPPYMMDSAHRAYRDGGGLFGGEVACEWVAQALSSLAAGGTMLLYTGAAIVAGEAPLLKAIAATCGPRDASVAVEEIDPDIFGEELEQPAYSNVERIAAVGIRITTRP